MCMFVQADSFIWSTYNIHMHPPSAAMYFQPPWYPYHFRQGQKFKESNKCSKSALPWKAQLSGSVQLTNSHWRDLFLSRPLGWHSKTLWHEYDQWWDLPYVGREDRGPDGALDGEKVREKVWPARPPGRRTGISPFMIRSPCVSSPQSCFKRWILAKVTFAGLLSLVCP